MKTLLLVGPDKTIRDYLARGLSGMTDEMRVLSAGDGEQAARMLASSAVDVLVTELIMPVMDGFELLSHVLEEHPRVEVVILGEAELGRTRQALSAGGAFRFLSRPVAVEDLIHVVRGILARPATGRLTGLSLPGFLQLLSAEGRSCSLRVRALGREGRVEMRDGELISASSNGSEGKEALFEALGWINPEIEVEEPDAGATRLIEDRLPSLLLEAALRLDTGEGATVTTSPEVGVGEAQRGADSGRVVGSFSTFAEVPLPEGLTTVARGLRESMQLEGTLGAGVVELETGRSLAHVCRGRSSYFAKMAYSVARAVRQGMHQVGDGSLRKAGDQLKLFGPKQFQVVRIVKGQPKLLLFFSGLVGRADVAAAADLLARLERLVLDS